MRWASLFPVAALSCKACVGHVRSPDFQVASDCGEFGLHVVVRPDIMAGDPALRSLLVSIIGLQLNISCKLAVSLV